LHSLGHELLDATDRPHGDGLAYLLLNDAVLIGAAVAEHFYAEGAGFTGFFYLTKKFTRAQLE
jgi:hypothetical protein